MKRLQQLRKLALITFLFIISSCSQDDDIINPETPIQLEVNTTSLFETVIEPEVETSGSYIYESEVLLDGEFMTVEAISDETSSILIELPGGGSNNNIEPGILTAGEWNDLDNWDFWTELLNGELFTSGIDTWNLKNVKRYSFQVLDNNNSYVANAEIKLFASNFELWKTKTDNKGKATLWSSLDFDELSASIAIGNTNTVVTDVKEYTNGINTIKLNTSIENEKIIDIYFVVDATGSMGDEIDYLKAELSNVIESVKEKNPILDMRFGSVFYRDEGDEYITRDLSFTNDANSLISFIQDQNASGGGNYPEAVHSALDVAITQNTWNENASSKLLFLLLDAPPHYNQEVISSLETSLVKAAQEGIKIIPITASGINKSTEYLMRSFAILTNGTYIFITDDSGIGNAHIEPTIGDYEVRKLNELLIDIIDQYIP